MGPVCGSSSEERHHIHVSFWKMSIHNRSKTPIAIHVLDFRPERMSSWRSSTGLCQLSVRSKELRIALPRTRTFIANQRASPPQADVFWWVNALPPAARVVMAPFRGAWGRSGQEEIVGSRMFPSGVLLRRLVSLLFYHSSNLPKDYL